MLLNHDAHIIEEAPLVGIRGMRRAVMFRKTFELEIELVSELAASGRGLGFDRHDNPALIFALRELRERLEGATLSVGGYLQPPFLDSAKSIGFDSLVVHYASLPDFTSADASELPE